MSENVATRAEDCETGEQCEDQMTHDSRLSSTSPPFALIAIVVTTKSFLERPERRRPKRLNFDSSVRRPNGALVVSAGVTIPNDLHLDRGHVVLLAGTSKPPSPTFEFYTFDVSSEAGQSITPWFGRTKQQPEGYDRNSFPLAVDEAEKVDAMFTIMANGVGDPKVVVPETSATLQSTSLQGQTPQLSRANTPASPTTPTTPDISNSVGWLSDDFLGSLKLNKNGKLVGYHSQWLRKDLEVEARRQAKARGITFGASQGRR
ncbi:hypothetical protein BDV96DRAFT_585071 [Lophiotrema nucula]|uniref:Uncharacterized protein n=1 Tax=Lophiotrema nucula TaxID=690887 RepID=A0A6A5YRB1_9PLEO|nr:hypothetical protein BDV96DRAFT_585071 [Lophiotrema nucula]